MSVYLFSLQEYDRAFARFANETLQKLMARKDPVLRKIKPVQSEQIPIVQNTMPSGKVVEGKPFRTEVKFSLAVDELMNGDLRAFVAALDDMAMDALKQMMPKFFERIGGLSEAAGTTVDARGEPLSYELYLRGLEKVEIDFDEQGNPILPTMVMGPDMYEAWQKLPPPTEAQQRALHELIQGKRREFDDRRHHRKLS